MRKFLLTIVAMLVCHTMQAQYFCTTEGTELSYVTYDEAGQSTSNRTVTVTNARTQDKVKYVTYSSKIVLNKSKNNTSYTMYDWSYDGESSVCKEDLMYGYYIDSDCDPDVYTEEIRNALLSDKKFKGDNSFVLKDSYKAGEELDDYSYSYQSGLKKTEVTISGVTYLGKEEVETTAGTFKCAKMSYLKRTKVALTTTTLRITEWYAKGIGLVKAESYNTKGNLDGKILLVKIKK